MAVTDSDDPAINYPAWTDYQKKNGFDPFRPNGASPLYLPARPAKKRQNLRKPDEGDELIARIKHRLRRAGMPRK